MPPDTPTQPPKGKEISNLSTEIITPLEVRKKSDPSELKQPFRFTAVTVIWLFIMLTLMITGGLFLIRYLSKHPVNLAKDTKQPESSKTVVLKKQDLNVSQTENEQAVIHPANEVATRSVQTANTAKLEQEKFTADENLANFLKLKKEVDDKNGSMWGGNEYNAMAAIGKKGDRLLMDRSFAEAATKYAQAADKAKALLESTAIVFQKLIQDGQKAIDNGESGVARQKFSLALKIQPSDESAQRNLKRAEKLDEVNGLITSGKNHEEQGRFAFAHTDYQRALQLDPESRQAQNSLNRIKEKIVAEEFKKLMSEGLTAYHNGHYQLARTTLLKAKSFRPDSREVNSALLQVDQAIRTNNIEKLQQKALAAEQAENWEKALESYLAVLKIDPDISFAVQGKTRALEYIRVTKRIGFFIEKPSVMESDQQLENAIRLIKEAEELEQKGPRLTARLNKLKILADLAGTPVKVMIESDNLTEIAVYKVGKLGKFTTRELSLRPGTYTVVGSRNGYQDVRVKIIVKPGQTSLRISIMCNTKV